MPVWIFPSLQRGRGGSIRGRRRGHIGARLRGRARPAETFTLVTPAVRFRGELPERTRVLARRRGSGDLRRRPRGG